MSAIDSAANFIVQIGLLLVITLFGLGSLDFQLTSALGDLDRDATALVLLIALGLLVAVIAIGVIALVRALYGRSAGGKGRLHITTQEGTI